VGDAKYGVNSKNRATGWKHQALCAYKLVFAFTTDAGALNYLAGRSFVVKDVPFMDLFPEVKL
jgi:23S rRNA pseudouridine955/2504/2580 synthase